MHNSISVIHFYTYAKVHSEYFMFYSYRSKKVCIKAWFTKSLSQIRSIRKIVEHKLSCMYLEFYLDVVYKRNLYQKISEDIRRYQNKNCLSLMAFLYLGIGSIYLQSTIYIQVRLYLDMVYKSYKRSMGYLKLVSI